MPLGAQAASRSAPVEVYEAGITDLQRAMTDGRVTSAQLVEAYLARITAYEKSGPALNAMIRLDPAARATARRLDEERRRGTVRGPLHGIPIILKDNFDTEGLATTGGSLALAGNVPTSDATVVRRLREAGAVIIGKSNLHELAAGIVTISSLGGQTRNPYDPRRNPGGSSGGTGAAIAASFATVGWGSDTCGSIRIPCAFASLVGLRPTQGLVSGSGIIPLSHTQDIAGPLARTVADLAIALDATIGADSADPGTRVLAGRTLPRFTDSLSATALHGARLGILANYMTDTDAEIADTIRAATRAMQRAGAVIVEVNVPAFDALMANSGVIPHEFKFDLIDYLAARPTAGVTSLREILDRGLYHDALKENFERREAVAARMTPAYRAALEKRTVIRDRIVQVMDSLGLDALVYPTVRRKPAFVGEAQLGANCGLAAQSGLPALSAPAGFGNDGLPIGIELLGRPWADARLVALAYAFEQQGSRRRAPPATPPLVNGRAPLPLTFTTVARTGAAVARTTFTYHRTRNELAYSVQVSGVPAARIGGIALMRAGPAGSAGDTTRTSASPARAAQDSSRAAADSTRAASVAARASHVVHRLLGPESLTASGTIYLDGVNLQALLDGRLEMALISTAGAPAGRTRLRLSGRRGSGP